MSIPPPQKLGEGGDLAKESKDVRRTVSDNEPTDNQCQTQISPTQSQRPDVADEPVSPGPTPVKEEERSLEGPVFVPRLYQQRYCFVLRTLTEYKVKSVVDLGSSECRICRHLIEIPTIERLALVDIDGDTLESNKFIIRPSTYDFIVRRESPLKIQIFEGSATELDSRISGYEAVSMVEIIEHLYPDVLDKVTSMVFGDLQPRVIVMTTPNADFNILFPGLTGFRHWDHKFEWSREQFQSWCQSLGDRYGYHVNFSGLGDPPPGSEGKGHCSQAAIFLRMQEHDVGGRQEADHTYRLVAESDFPFKEVSHLSSTELLALEVEYQIHLFQNDDRCQDDEGQTIVPLESLCSLVERKYPINVDQLREFLREHDYKMSVEEDRVIVPPLDLSSDEDSLYTEDDTS